MPTNEHDAHIHQLKEELVKRKAAEMALLRGEQNLRSILEMSPVGVGIFRNSDYAITFVNSSCAALLGYSFPFDVLGRSLSEHWMSAEQFREVVTRLEATESMAASEVLLKTKAGKEIWGLVSMNFMELDQESCTLFWILDISEKKHNELEVKKLNRDLERTVEDRTASLLNALADADRANRAKSEFLASMSHELRTPLNAIIGFSQIWINEVFGPVENPKYMGYANDINQASTHLLNIISDILDLSKIEAGEIRLKIEDVEFKEIVESVVAMLKEQATSNGIELIYSVPQSLQKLRADKRYLKQILINLVGNALKFTHNNGRVDISADTNECGWLVVEISDTGVGIPAENIAVALEPFGQIRSSALISHEGTGLGLPLAKRLIELHGGSMSITSETGKGTIVQIKLPYSGALL